MAVVSNNLVSGEPVVTTCCMSMKGYRAVSETRASDYNMQRSQSDIEWGKKEWISGSPIISNSTHKTGRDFQRYK